MPLGPLDEDAEDAAGAGADAEGGDEDSGGDLDAWGSSQGTVITPHVETIELTEGDNRQNTLDHHRDEHGFDHRHGLRRRIQHTKPRMRIR